MDERAFDRITRSLAAVRSRRGALRLVTAGALGSALGWHVAAPMPIRGKGKGKKNRCRPNWESCAIGAGKSCCSGADKCCLPYDPHGLGEDGPYCTAKDNHCCGPEAGGGSCGNDEICCKTTARYRGVNDYCEKVGGECCNDPIGGSCAPGFSCCVDPTASPQYTCCADPARAHAGAAAIAPRVGRNFHPRQGKARAGS